MIPITKSSLFCLLTLSAALAAQDHDLSIQAKKGATVWLTRQEKVEQVMDVSGQEMETGKDVTTVLQCTIKDVDEKGLMIVETKIVRVHGTMTIPMMGDIEFDSAAPAEDEDDGDDDGGGMGMPSTGAITKSQTALAGKTFVAKIDSKGKAAALEGVAEMLKEAKKGLGMMPGPSEGDLRHLVESAFGFVPEQPMAVGSSWDHKSGDGSRMPGASMKLTLAKVDDDSFEITSTGTIDQPTGEGDDPSAKMLKSMKIASSKVSGSQRVSRQDGFVVDASNTVEMDSSMDGPMGGEMTMKVKSTTTMKRTTAEAAMPAKKPVEASK